MQCLAVNEIVCLATWLLDAAGSGSKFAVKRLISMIIQAVARLMLYKVVIGSIK